MTSPEDVGKLSAASGIPVWMGFVSLILWARVESTWALAAGAVFAFVSLVGVRGGPRRGVSALLVLIGVAVGLRTEAVDRRLANDWRSYWDGRREEVGLELEAAMNELVARGDSSVARVVRTASTSAARAVLQDSLRVVVEEAGVSGAAVYGPGGSLLVWAGGHRGLVPNELLRAESQYSYFGTPLFSHLYFTAKIPGGLGTAMVASPMRSELPEAFASGLGDFVSRFRDETGERIRIARSDRVSGPGVFDFGWEDEPLLSFTVQEPDPVTRRSERRSGGIYIVIALAALVWCLESFGGPRRNLPFSVAALCAAAAVLPLERPPMSPELVDPDFFRLRGPVPLTLGRVLMLCVAAVPLAVMAAPRWKTVGRWLALPVVALGFPVILLWMAESASLELLGTTDGRWIAFQASITLILTLIGGVALGCRVPGETRSAPALILFGIAVAAILSVGVAVGVRVGPRVSLSLAALWMLPAVLVARGLDGSRHLSHVRWLCAFWLAGTAALPFAWSMRTEARLQVAEYQMARLGVTPEPYPDSLLELFADQAVALELAGAGDVELMYQSWVTSGLAAHGSPILLTLWSEEDVPLQELRLGVKGERSPAVDAALTELRSSGVPEYRRPGETDVHHLLAVPLGSGRLVTGAIPPRRSIDAPSTLGPLFASVEEGGGQEFLTLVRTADDAPPPAERSPVAWARNDEGWRGEGLSRYPDGLYLVFYTISIPNLQVMLARATLVLALDFGVFAMLWLLSVGILGMPFPGPVDWRGLYQSFRARVTWTLFGFFILSSALFGALAYRTLAGASERTATALAERVVSQIGEAYLEEGGSMESLARRVGADLLEYRGGELVGGSVDELIELGLYEGWVDPRIYDALETRQSLRASKVENLGGWRYVMAYRRLPDGDIVASPVPLRAGAAALRRRDVADLLGFAIVLGPLLSLGLALFVGRALTRPIQTLQVASERVGGGNLAVHLPEGRVDEFGSVFAAFNRMVLRLDNARRELLRTTRRTEAIVEEVATGVIAVDTGGRITVANPRAELLLEASLEAGRALPGTAPHAAELAGWLDGFYGEGGGVEQDADFQWGERRIRARARRIAHEGHLGGVVVNLEDVTDELRAERILAWGEMANQVAHEVKNPLTPIKLSVQHLRRAWSDRRRDFGRILERNVGAILSEIDRLASIARSFSRLASPGAAEQGPLVSVDLAGVLREVLDLYRGAGESSIRVESDAPDPLPPVLCRPDELKEVLLNLLENARAAMPGGGVVRIRAKALGGSQSMVLVTVDDEGTGIPAELLPRIFEPRFSTRSTGSGLGLPIAKRLVDSWGGLMEVESVVGEGTRVSVRLRAGGVGTGPDPEGGAADDSRRQLGDGGAGAIE